MFRRGDTVEYIGSNRNLKGNVGAVLGPSLDFRYRHLVCVRWWYDPDNVQIIHPANLRLVKGDQNVQEETNPLP